MIITTTKSLEEILDSVSQYKSLFLIGCKECAATCETGGEKEVQEMAKVLESKGKTVTGYAMVQAGCFDLDVKRHLRMGKEQIDKTDAILILSCGAGTQSVSEVIDLPAIPALNTHFLGNIKRTGQFEERCSLCGECVLASTGGICPITRCAKGLLVGPCGGVNNGKCEVDSEKDCAWVLIYNRLSERGQLDQIKDPLTAKDFSKAQKPKSLKLGEAK
jgi:ferredoxin